MSNNAIEFAVVSSHLCVSEQALLIRALQSRFDTGDQGFRTRAEHNNGQRLVVSDGPCGVDRYVCFAPQTPKEVGRIQLYAEESGCGGESSRLHSRGHVDYRI